MPIQLIWFAYWLGVSLMVGAVYVLVRTGRLYCAKLFIGHCLAVLKEEVMRPLRVIGKALSRKERKRPADLDEYEKSIS